MRRALPRTLAALSLSLVSACAGGADVTGTGLGNSGGNGGRPVTPSTQPARIDFSVTSLGFGAIGASGSVSVLVRDASGTLLPNAAVTWSSADITVADVSGTGTTATVTARAPGRTVIRATAGSVTQELQVNVSVVRTITLPPAAQVRAGGSSTLTPEFDADAGASTQVRWESSDPTIASVANGVVTGVRTGSTVIRAISISDPRVSASVQLTVNPARSVVVRNVPERVFVGDEVQLSATLDVDDGESKAVEWSTSAPAVAIVTPSGRLVTVGAGNVVVRVRSIAFDAVRDSVALRVRMPWIVSVSPGVFSLAPGQTQQLRASVQIDEGMSTNVTWRSADATVAMVASNGMVTAVAPGTAKIVAVSVADTTLRAEATVSVVAQVRSVQVQPEAASMVLGGTRQFTASVMGDPGVSAEVIWRSANPSVALVSASGLVTAIATGSTSITAISRADTTRRASGTVTITTGVRDVDVEPSAVTIGIGEHRQFSAAVSGDPDADTRVQWRTSNGTVASVSASGMVTGVSAGAAVITAVSLADTTRRNNAIVTVQSIPVVTVSPTSLALELGQMGTLAATVQADAGVSTGVTWRSSNPAVATVNGTGQVTAVGNGSAVVTAVSSADTTRRASATVTVATVPRVAAVSVTPSVVQLSPTQSVQLVPTVTVSGGASQAVTYRSNNPAVASVNFTGLVTALTSGTATITVTSSFDPNRSATASVTVSAASTQLATSWSSSRLGGALYDDVVSIDAAGTSSAFAVNEQGDVFHLSGGAWVLGARGSSFTTKFLAVSASSASNAVAVGTNGAIVRFDGTSWTRMTSGTQQTLNGIHVESGTTAFAVGAGGLVLRLSGSSWASMNSGSTETLYGVWTSGTSGFAVGTAGEMLRWNGSAWSRQSPITSETLYGVNAISSSNAVAVGSFGTVLRWNGSVWTRVNAGNVAADLYNVAGSTANSNRYYIASDDGLYALNSSTLSLVSTPYAPRLLGAAIDASGNVWTSGQRGIVMRLTGATWETVSLAPDLIDVWTTSASNAWAVGEFGFVYRWNGSGWSRQSTPTTGTLNAVWGASATEAFAGGDNGTMLRFNGASWSTMSFPSTSTVYGIWGSASNNVYAVTADGEVLRFNGSSWTLARTSTSPLWAVFGSSASDVYVSGETGMAMRFNGSTWTSVNTSTTGTLAGIWASGPTNVLAVGSSSSGSTGVAFGNAGSGWTSLSMPTSAMLTSVWGPGANDVYATGDAGLIVRFNGSSWSTMSSGTADLLWAVSGAPTGIGGAFAVGYNSTVAAGTSSSGMVVSGLRALRTASAMDLDPRAGAKVVRGALPSGKDRRNRKH